MLFTSLLSGRAFYIIHEEYPDVKKFFSHCMYTDRSKRSCLNVYYTIFRSNVKIFIDNNGENVYVHGQKVFSPT